MLNPQSSKKFFTNNIIPDLYTKFYDETIDRVQTGHYDNTQVNRGKSMKQIKLTSNSKISQKSNTYREAFNSRVHMQQKQYLNLIQFNKSLKNEYIFGNKISKKLQDQKIWNKIIFVQSQFKVLQEYFVQQNLHSSVVKKFKQIYKFLGSLFVEISVLFDEKKQITKAQSNKMNVLQTHINKICKENEQLSQTTKKLIKLQKGVPQLKMFHQNSKLKLSINELTVKISQKQKQLQQLKSKISDLKQKNMEYQSKLSVLQPKVNRLTELLQLSQHTKQINMHTKMKYIFQ